MSAADIVRPMRRELGARVRVGDCVWFLGKPHRIRSLDPYSFRGTPARIARCEDGWVMTIFGDGWYEVE